MNPDSDKSLQLNAFPDLEHEDGTLTDAIGVPCGYSTRSRMPSREDEKDAFAEWCNERVAANTKGNK